MQMPPGLLLALALVALVFAAAMWFLYVRPAPEITDGGVITSKVFIPARTIERYQGGPRSESYSQQKTAIPDSYLFGIRLQGLGETVQLSMGAQAGAKFQVGQTVQVHYAERGIPFVSKRIQALGMSPSGANPP